MHRGNDVSARNRKQPADRALCPRTTEAGVRTVWPAAAEEAAEEAESEEAEEAAEGEAGEPGDSSEQAPENSKSDQNT